MNEDLQDLLADITDTSGSNIHHVFTKLQDLMDGSSSAHQDAAEVKRSLFRHGVLQFCSSSLRISPAQIQGGCVVLTQMADLLSSCCVGLGSFREADVFNHTFLPSVVDSLLFLAYRLMNRALRDKAQTERTVLFIKVVGSLSWILGAHSHLIDHMLSSKHYQSVQLCEDEDISIATVSMWNDVFRSCSAAVTEMGMQALTGIMDDIVYKMSSSCNPVLGRAAVKTLVVILEHNSQSLQLIHKRYRGLADLAEKDWRGKGFDTTLHQLLDLLRIDATCGDREEKTAERVKAACIIQASWRAKQTRQKLKKLHGGVSTFQRSFREKQQRQKECEEQLRKEEELRHQVLLQRQRAMRQFHQHKLHLMEKLSAGQVERFLGLLENKAALLLQKMWRGHRARRNFQKQRHILIQHRAAVVLQRVVLRFLKRRKAQRHFFSPMKVPKGLTDSRKAELRRKIEDHISLHPSCVMSSEGGAELHGRAQSFLHQHLMNRASERQREHHRQALIVQINSDLELLTNPPSLKEAGAQDSSLFMSRSRPVATRARQSHNEVLQSLHLPWWRLLEEKMSGPEQISFEVCDMDINFAESIMTFVKS